MGDVTNPMRKQKLKKFEKGESSPKLLPNDKNDNRLMGIKLLIVFYR